MARIIEGVKETKTLLYAHPAAVDAGDVIVKNGMVLIAVNDADADETNVWMFAGRAALPKATGAGSGIDAPARVYYDADANVITTTPGDNAPAGVCIESADTDDDEAIIDMDGPYFVSIAEQKILNFPLLSATEMDGTLLAAFSGGDSSTPGIDTISSEVIGVRWNNHAQPDPILMSVPIPPDLDPDSDMTIHVLAAKTGATEADATTFDAGVFVLTAGMLYDSDADCGGTTDAMTGDATAETLQEVTVTVAANDLSSAPGVLSLTLQPTDGSIDTDDVVIAGVWAEYAGKLLTA